MISLSLKTRVIPFSNDSVNSIAGALMLEFGVNGPLASDRTQTAIIAHYAVSNVKFAILDVI